EIRIQARVNGDVVETSVSDTGIGIAEENMERIFRSFEQVGSSISREYGGVGLGLSITKHLVELSGGEMKVASRLGEGSVFTFTLPVGKESDEVTRSSVRAVSNLIIPDSSMIIGAHDSTVNDRDLTAEGSYTIL